MPLLRIETPHLSYCEVSDIVYLRCLDDEISLGPLADTEAECPTLLLPELRLIEMEVREGRATDRAYRRTVAAADRMRHSPEGWRP